MARRPSSPLMRSRSRAYRNRSGAIAQRTGALSTVSGRSNSQCSNCRCSDGNIRIGAMRPRKGCTPRRGRQGWSRSATRSCMQVHTPSHYASRIVCLTEETTETLYLLGEESRIVGISGFTVRPPRARREKPRVSAFTSAKIEKIVELRPDLVLGFSDLQADIAAELIRAGIEVHVFNHRSVAQILRMIATLGALVGCPAKAAELVEKLEAGIEQVGQSAARFPRRPRV